MRTLIRNLLAATGFTVASLLAPILVSAIVNARALGTGFAMALRLSLYAPLLIGSCVLALLSALPERTRAGRWLRLGLLLATALALLYSTLFLWRFGPFDGSPVAVADHLPEIVLELLAGTVMAVMIVRHRQALADAHTWVCALFGCLALLPLVGQAKAMPDAARVLSEHRELTLDLGDPRIVALSARRNVLVFVVDALQTDTFLRSLERVPGLARDFADFTCFRNNSGAASSTTFAVPAMLSGIPYDGALRSSDYFSRAMLGPTSLPVILGDRGYDVRLFTQHTIPYQPGIAAWHNVGQEGLRAAVAAGWLELMRLALYRVAPTPIKLALRDERRIAAIKAGFVARVAPARPPLVPRFDDAALLRRLQGSEASLSAPTLRWLHLQGVHPPFTLVPQEEQARLGLAESYQLQADRLLQRLAATLRGLRQSSIYERATILVLGDHGLADTRVPALLVKRAGASGPLAFDNAPSSIIDLPATVLADLGIEAPHLGHDTFDLQQLAARERRFFEFYGLDSFSGRPRMMTTHVSTSGGDVGSSWKVAEVRYPALEGKEGITHYVSFTQAGFVAAGRVRGNYTRTAPGVAWAGWLEVDVRAPWGKTVLVEVLYHRYHPEPRKIVVQVDGVPYGELFTAPYETLRLIIPGERGGRSGSTAKVRFTYPPGGSQDTLLFVDLLATTVSSSITASLTPSRFGANCELNTIWAVGGGLWEGEHHLLVIADGQVSVPTVDRSRRRLSFSVPPGSLSRPLTFLSARCCHRRPRTRGGDEHHLPDN